MGMQAMLPGMIYMHELMAEQIAQMRAVLGQEAEDVPRITAADLGIEPEIKTETKRARGDHKSYWEKLTPDERSAEMMRRVHARKGMEVPAGYINTLDASKILGATIVTVRRWATKENKIRFKRVKPAKGGPAWIYVSKEDVQRMAAQS